MAQFRSDVPDIGVSVNITKCRLIGSVSSISLSGSSLSAQLKDGLTQDAYERVSKQIRVLYSFCFEQVYSEDYDVMTTKVHYSYGGHNERKGRLLHQNSPVSEEFGSMGRHLFEDIAALGIRQANLRRFFNSAFIWSRANELNELKLMTEAYEQYWRLLDLVNKKSDLGEAPATELLQYHHMPPTRSNRFAIRILHKMGMLKGTKPSNIESLAFLDRLRHPHAHQASDQTDYYMEDDTHLEAKVHNIFISYITKLFVIWELGLRDYYLKPRGNIYELAKTS